MSEKKRSHTYSEILDLAKTTLYKHLRALRDMPSTEEQVSGKKVPKGFLTERHADFVRKCVNDVYKIYVDARGRGDEDELADKKTSEVASQLEILLEERDGQAREGNRAMQA